MDHLKSGHSLVHLIEPNVGCASGESEPSNDVGQVLIAECDSGLATNGATGSSGLRAGINVIGIRSCLNTHLYQVTVQVLRATTLWTELWSGFVQADYSGDLHFALHLSGRTGDGVHLLLANPATVDQDGLSGRGEIN